MDKKLFKSFFKKEEWAVRKVYNNYSRLIKHVSYQILHDNDLCDDIVNETFIHLLNQGQTDNEKSFVAYMCSTAHNLSINMAKERAKYESLNEDIASSNDEKTDDILAILEQKLEQDEYNILILHAVLEYPFNDIASAYNLTASAARGIYFRCKKKAKTLLEGLL